MGDPHVITALVRKRAELSGEISEINRRAAAIRAQITNIDGSLRLFGYDKDPNEIAPIRKQYGRLFKRGQLQRVVLDATRDMPGLVSNKDIAASIIQKMNWDQDDSDLHASLTGRVKDVRKRHRGR